MKDSFCRDKNSKWDKNEQLSKLRKQGELGKWNM